MQPIEKFTILGELTDLNTYIKALNASRWSGNDIKQLETKRVAKEARNSNISEIKTYPVLITFKWYSKNKKKDIDNIAFAKKFVLDGLVVSGYLKQDSQNYIVGFTDLFYIDKNRPRIS